MSTGEHLVAMSMRRNRAGLNLRTRAKAVALQAIQTLSGTASDALVAYANVPQAWCRMYSSAPRWNLTGIRSACPQLQISL